MLHPEEIDNQQFEVSFRGYNTREVDEFLNQVRIELEEMIKEQDVLRRKIAAAELIAKEAKDHEEEFISSMKAEKDHSQATLQSSKAEGERIIREAKNAASGIMAEVRRRANEISKETKRASAELEAEAKENAAAILSSAETEAAAAVSAAKREAENIMASARAEVDTITAAAKAAAEDKLFSARTEADNIVKAAVAEARVTEEEARRNSAAAVQAAAACEAYMNDIKKTADSICRELDIELKNSASRISLLGRRIAAMDVSMPTELTDTEAEVSNAAPAAPETVSENDTVINEEPAAGEIAAEGYTVAAEESPRNIEAEPEVRHEGGYFTKEYRQVMEELFGEGGMASADADDDTYDYTDRVVEESDSLKKIKAALEGNFDDEDGEITDSDEVTDEYVGFSEIVEDDESFNTADLDMIYKSPSADDIDDIMNGF